MNKNNSNHKKKLSVDKIKACAQALGIRPAAKALKIPKSTVFGIVHDKKVPQDPSSTSALSQSDLVALKMAAAKLGGPNLAKLTIQQLDDLYLKNTNRVIERTIILWLFNRNHWYEGTFEEFCETHFHTSRSHGYHMVNFAGVYLDILRIGTARHEDLTRFLTHETLSRPLARLTSAEQRFEAFGMAIAQCKKTGDDLGEDEVREAVYTLVPSLRPPPKESPAESGESKAQERSVQMADLIRRAIGMISANHKVQDTLKRLLALASQK